MKKIRLIAALLVLFLLADQSMVVGKAAEETQAVAQEQEISLEIIEEEAPEGLPVLSVAAENITGALLSSISGSVEAMVNIEQSKPAEYSADDLMYLACIIYCEAGNQSFTGKVAVANVVMNRAASEEFDHVTSIKEAIYDCERWGRQFSPVYVKSGGKWTTKGSSYEKALNMYKTGKYAKEWQESQMKDCIAAADAALRGKYVLKGDYLYFNMYISATKSKCEKKNAGYQVIGCHIFY